MAQDTWITTDLDTIFSGTGDALTAVQTELNKVQGVSAKVIQQFTEKATAATQGLAVANDLLNQLKASGFNVLFMEPDNRPFSQRLDTANNPPKETEYSAAVVFVAQSPSLALTVQRYQALLKIIKAPIEL